MPKPNQQNGSPGKPRTKVFASLRNHKLVVILLILVLIFPANYAYSYYKDWDNAQMIKGLAQDFPALVSEIESATGLDLEIKADCSITQEKFSEGVKTCELRVSEKSTQDNILKGEQILQNSESFGDIYTRDGEIGRTVMYRGSEGCTYSLIESLSFVCITAVNEANIDLAREVFINQ